MKTKENKYTPRMSFWANKKISLPKKVNFGKEKRKCRHDWRVGSYIGSIIKNKIRKIGINIFCFKCGKKIKAYYPGKINLKKRKLKWWGRSY